jgi:hypothetical protein
VDPDPAPALKELMRELRDALATGKEEARAGVLSARTYVAIAAAVAKVQGYVLALNVFGVSAGKGALEEALSLLEDSFVINLLRNGPPSSNIPSFRRLNRVP